MKSYTESDRPAREVQEIEITPEMVEAGVRILWGSGTVDERLEADRLLVRDIFAAMFGAASHVAGRPKDPETC